MTRLLLALPLCAALLPTPASAQAEWMRGLADFMRAMAGQHQPLPPVCREAPLGKRELFLRGSFNAWAADDAWRMRWSCNQYVLVAAPTGEQTFKIGDEAWSADADWGGEPGADKRQFRPRGVRVEPAGAPLAWRFDGSQKRFVFRFRGAGKPPVLSMNDCLPKPPLGDAQLYLRGSMNNWAALDDYAFKWQCDAYYLNVRISGRQDFKIGDAAWTATSTLAANGSGQPTLQAQGGNANLVRHFEGEQTLVLSFDAEGKPQLSLGPKSFADPADEAINDKAALSARFDSRQLAHKTPFGAQPVGSAFDFAVSGQGLKAATLVVERRELVGNQEKLAYHSLARVAMSPQTDGRWTARHAFAEPGVFGYWFEIETADGRYSLQNNRDSVYWTREKGSMGPSSIERLPENLNRVRRYRQTVHLPQLRVPEWSADVVYYYVFPERFRNGNKANDPQPGKARYQNHDVEKHARWLEKPYRPGDAGDAVYNNDFFGGDLQGLIDKLDDIKALGANTLYLTPVFQAPSNHKYDTADYLQIDPGFGTNADFKRLTEEAAKRGMRVIPDTSLNHVGADSRYFDRFGNFGGKDGAFANGKPNPASPYASWFLFDASKKDPSEQFQGWVGIKDLPELDKDSPAWRRFAYADDNSVTRHWLRQGAAGWRMDVAPWVNDSFWREWSAVVKAEKPDALTVAETWFDASKYFIGDMFDSTMNYIFRNAVLDFAAGGKGGVAMANLELTREAYPAPMLHAAMNLLSTHDQARALHVFGVPGNPHTDAVANPAQLAEAKQRLLLALLFQMGFPGAPTVYYGDEVGVGGGDDPYNRATYPWADEGGQPDLQLRAQFQRLIAMRHAHPVLRRGTLSAPLLVRDDLIVLHRQLGEQHAIVVLSNSKSAQSSSLPLASLPAQWRDALSNGALAAQDGQLRIDVPALFGRVLLSQP